MNARQHEQTSTSSVDFYDLIAPVYDYHWGRRFFPAAARHFRRHVAPRVTAGARILDLCCGSGHFAAYLDRAGYRVTGIDSSPELLARARERSPGARLVLSDMSDFDVAERFDAAVSCYNSLNQAQDEAELAMIFGRVAYHVAPAGFFLFDLMSEEEYLNSWSGYDCVLSADYLYELDFSYLASTRTATCQVRVRSRDDLSCIGAEAVSEQRPFAVSVVRNALRSAGFSVIFVKRFRRPNGRLLILATRLNPSARPKVRQRRD